MTAYARRCASESRGEAAPILARRRVKMTPTRMTARRAAPKNRTDDLSTRFHGARPTLSLRHRASMDTLDEFRRTRPAESGAPPRPNGTQWTPRDPSRLLRRRSSMLIGFPFLKRVRAPRRAAPYHILLISSHTVINSSS